MGILDKILGREDNPPDRDKERKKPNFGGVKTGGGSTLGEQQPQVSTGAGSTMGERTSSRPAPAPSAAGAQAAPGPQAQAASPQTYEVKSGDSLSKIAKQVYGNGNDWPRIFEANRDQIKDPDLIHPGQKLVIP